MTGSTISIIVMTAAFALFAFVFAYLISSIVAKDKINADKRLDELKKQEGDVEDFALVKHESRREKIRKQQRKEGGFFDKFGSAVYKELQRADIKMRPEEFVTIWLIITVLPAALIAMLLDNATVALIVMLICLFAPIILIRVKQKQRVKLFESQLSDALMIACSCLKSGLSFTQAMETISKDMDDPISYEFQLVIQEMGMGASMDEALEKLNTRVKSNYLSLMVSAVLVQRQTGGNLSQILENIANTIKEKIKLKKEFKSSIASGKTSGTVVGLMPFIMLVLFYIVNKDFIMPLFTEPLGRIFLGVAIGLDVLCFVVVSKITSIKM